MGGAEAQANPRGDCGFLAGICEFLENWNDGQRQPSNLAYSVKGLKVVNSATVHKVVFAEDDAGVPKASAAVLQDGRQFKARKEIVLSADAIKTPQILMLSGIGPAEMLSKHDIPVVYNAPEVGKNYFDHFAHCQVWNLRNPDKALSLGTPDWNDPAFYKGLPCDWTVNEAVPLELLEPAFQADAPKGLVSDESLLDPARCFLETMVVYSSLSAPVPADGSYIATSVMLLVPTSRASITITSASPSDTSVIDPNYYHTEVDRSALIYGARRVAKVLLETSAGKDYIECEGTPPRRPPLNAGSSDSDIDARIRATGMPHAHSAGTAAMGKVVDSSFRVKGVSGLRVADASVFPVAIGGHPQATLYGIAEQAAEMILQDE